MNSLYLDLMKPAAAAHISTMGLGLAVEKLNTLAKQYASLIDSRAANQIANVLEAGKIVRIEMDKQYDHIATMAFVANISTPTDKSAAFITSINKLIADTNTEYNMRTAQKKSDKTIEKA